MFVVHLSPPRCIKITWYSGQLIYACVADQWCLNSPCSRQVRSSCSCLKFKLCRAEAARGLFWRLKAKGHIMVGITSYQEFPGTIMNPHDDRHTTKQDEVVYNAIDAWLHCFRCIDCLHQDCILCSMQSPAAWADSLVQLVDHWSPSRRVFRIKEPSLSGSNRQMIPRLPHYSPSVHFCIKERIREIPQSAGLKDMQTLSLKGQLRLFPLTALCIEIVCLRWVKTSSVVWLPFIQEAWRGFACWSPSPPAEWVRLPWPRQKRRRWVQCFEHRLAMYIHSADWDSFVVMIAKFIMYCQLHDVWVRYTPLCFHLYRLRNSILYHAVHPIEQSDFPEFLKSECKMNLLYVSGILVGLAIRNTSLDVFHLSNTCRRHSDTQQRYWKEVWPRV